MVTPIQLLSETFYTETLPTYFNSLGSYSYPSVAHLGATLSFTYSFHHGPVDVRMTARRGPVVHNSADACIPFPLFQLFRSQLSHPPYPMVLQ